MATSDRPRWTSAQRRVLGLTGLDSPMAMLDALFVTTALSAIRVDLGASIEELKVIAMTSITRPTRLASLPATGFDGLL
jgi:hypothetical protein